MLWGGRSARKCSLFPQKGWSWRNPPASGARKVGLDWGWTWHCIPVSPQCPPWSNIHLPQPQHGQGNKGMGKTHPQPISQLSKGAPGKSLSQPYTAGDNGDKQREPVSPSWVCALPALTRDSSGTQSGPPAPQCMGQHTGTTQLCQHPNGTKPTSTALSKQQWFPSWLSATPMIKMMVKYFIICSNYPQNINHCLAASPRGRGDIRG